MISTVKMADNIPMIALLGFALLISFSKLARTEVEDAFSSTDEDQKMADFDGFENDREEIDESDGNDFDKDGAVVCWWADDSGCESCCLDAKFINHYWDDLNGCTCDILYENKDEQSGDNDKASDRR